MSRSLNNILLSGILLPGILFFACGKSISPQSTSEFSQSSSTHVQSGVAQQLLNLTGGVRTKLVWLQARLISEDTANYVSNLSDYIFNAPASQLVVFDTDEDTGRFLDPIPSPRSTPVISRDGNKVLWSDYNKKALYMINWDGTGKKILLQGNIYQVVYVQWDDRTSTEWVYVSDVFYYPVVIMSAGSMIYRYALKGMGLDTANRELISKQVFFTPWTVSSDGKFAGSIFKWPHPCIESLLDGQLYPVIDSTGSCMGQIAPDTSYLYLCFHLSHYDLTLYNFINLVPSFRGEVPLNALSGVDYCAPRWTNHARYLTIGYPYDAGWFFSYVGTPLPSDPKSIPPGMTGEFCLGKFDANFTAIDWVRVTDNDIRFRKVMGDAWLADGEGPGKIN